MSAAAATIERDRAAMVDVVERWITAFNDGFPTEDELRELLTDDVTFLERPNLFNTAGSARDRAGMLHGIELGRGILATQRFEPLGHVVEGDQVVTRMRWTGTLSADAGPFRAGTRLEAWCVGHYTLRDGRIAHIEQHDCYDKPVPPTA